MVDPRLFVASAKRPGRYAVTLHDPSVHPGDQHPSKTFFALERMMFTGAGVTFTHGEALVEDTRRNKPWLKGPIEIVPHGVDMLDPAPPSWRCPTGRRARAASARWRSPTGAHPS